MRIVHRLVLSALYLLGLGTVAIFAWKGQGYYLTPLAERPRHPLYWQLKPGGELGLVFGITGATMMVVMLAYSLRKRLPWLSSWGPVSLWLDYHIFLGLCGPLFILLHSSFKVQGLVALSFWSMVAVALSGIAGRYLYRQIPHNSAGDELSLAELERQDAELGRELSEEFRLPPEALRRLDALALEGTDPGRSLAALVFRLPFDLSLLRLRLRRFGRDYPQLDRVRRRAFERRLFKKAVLLRRMAFWQRLRQLFHYWHVFHKPFAVVMYLFLLVHVGVAVLTGYGWVSH
ncbi:MAG: hypothetical protein U0002_16950 [Thermoanaerobaculia bacterium]